MMTQSELARMLDLDVSTVNKILNRTPGSKFRKETIDRVERAAREQGYDLTRLKHRHGRKDARVTEQGRVTLRIEDGDGEILDRGSAELVDLSLGGARLKRLDLDSRVLPLKPFVMVLTVRGLEIHGRLIRFAPDREMEAALRFDATPARLRKLLEGRSPVGRSMEARVPKA